MSVVLIVSPSDGVHAVLRRVVTGRGRSVSIAMTGTEGLELLRQRPFEMAVIDPMISDIPLASVISGMTELEPVMPIHVLPPSVSADRVKRHDWSPVRYLFDPADVDEAARVLDSALARAAGGTPTPHLTAGHITLEPESGQVSVHGKRIVLTGRESLLLRTFMTADGEVRTLTDLHAAVSGNEPNATAQAVAGTLRTLRRKLPPGYIESIFGRGYRLRV